MRPSLITTMRSASVSSSSRSSLTSSTAQPRLRAAISRPWISATAAKSSPNTGLLTSSSLASPASSRASTARCTLPPDSVRIAARSPCVLTPYSAIQARARCRSRPQRTQPPVAGWVANGVSSNWRSAMLWATLRSPTQALCSGSSGSARTCRWRFWRRVALKGWPATCTRPASRRRWPVSDCISSRWPLPETPATPTISPARTSRLKSCTAASPRSPITCRPLMAKCTGPLSRRSRVSVTTTALPSPTIACARRCGVVAATAVLSTSAPRRSTLTSSACAVTSRNLWVIRITEQSPAWARSRSAPSTSSASCGVSTEVGSSRISSRGLRNSCLRISSFCFSPADKSSGVASRSSWNGAVARKAFSSARAAFQSITAGMRPRANSRFSATVMPGTTVKCW